MDPIDDPIEGPNDGLSCAPNDAPTTAPTDTSNANPAENPIGAQDWGPNDAPIDAPGNNMNAPSDDPVDHSTDPDNAPKDEPTDDPVDGQNLGQNEAPNNAPAVDPNVEELDINAKIIAESNARRKAINTKGYLAELLASFQRRDPIQPPLSVSPPLLPVQPVTAENPSREASGEPIEWSKELEREESPGYDEIFAWYYSLPAPTLEETVKFKGAEFERASRRKRSIGENPINEGERVEPRQQSVQSDNELFFCLHDYVNPSSNQDPREDTPGENNQVGEPIQGVENQKPGPAKRKRQTGISAKERKRSMRLGLEACLAKAKRGTAKGSRKRKADGPAGDQDDSRPRNKGKRQRVKRLENSGHHGLDFNSLFAPEIIRHGNASSRLPSIPMMTGKNKKKALTDLVANLPASDNAEAKSDKKLIMKATRDFEYSAKSDGSGGWKIKGLNTSLFHYQLLGASFMRKREKSPHPPFGGMLCDVMGFGKTIQALANIVDGNLREPNPPVRTTLIVVPPHLVRHWKRQIALHCDRSVIGTVVEHHAATRISGIDPEQTTQMLQTFDIVITTYDEIRKSYPKFRAPSWTTNNEQIEKEWNEVFRESLGPLHRIKFRRILIDEGHVIKNHMSQTAIAIRALHSHYKWVISGTPLHNSIEECYSYFDFLDVPHTGSYEDFCHNYTKTEKSQECLKNIIRAILFRRTHDSKLFALPVIKLPRIAGRTVEATFCDVEHAIYNRIFTIFIDNINGMAAHQKLAKYRCFLTMILKLRMFSSHALIIQDMLKQMLTDDMMGQLIQISNQEKSPEQPSSKITRWLIALRKKFRLPGKPAESAKETASAQENQESREPDTGALTRIVHGDTEKLVRQFHQFTTKLHENEQWAERLSRTNCPRCGMFPEEMIITSCKHLYCAECYCRLREGNSQTETGNPTCLICNVEITEAAHCDSIDNFQPVVAASEATTAFPTPGAPKSKKNKKKPVQKKNGFFQKYGMFSGSSTSTAANDANIETDEDEETDWIASAAAADMPGAKLEKVREVITDWFANSQETKVVVFTQFLDFVRILGAMCKKENWGYQCLTGKMLNPAREKSMENFKNDLEIRILLASLKAGGTGLDMSMANKCILVDPWWNEAVQDQAMCRLYRIGQLKEVEFVKIVVRATIDTYLLEIQGRKTAEIDRTIGKEALEQRETIAELLDMFGAVWDDQSGGFIFIPNREERDNEDSEEQSIIELD